MLMFTLAISCMTSFQCTLIHEPNIPVPAQFCSLQHHSLLSPPDTSTTGHHFHFGSASSFFLELFLCSSPVACWTPTNLTGSPFKVLPFCLFILFMGFSRQECWSGLPFLSPVNHILSELSTMTHPSWVALCDMAHSSLSYTKLWFMWSFWLVFCDCSFHSACPLMDADKRPVQASRWEGLAVGKTGFCFGGGGHAQ